MARPTRRDREARGEPWKHAVPPPEYLVPRVDVELSEPNWFLVLGGSDSLWDDVAAVETLLGRPWPGLVVATNDAGVAWPRRLDHWATKHPEDIAAREREREARAREHGYTSDGHTTWARRNPTLVDRILEEWGGSSSGLYAITVGEEVTEEPRRGILCGMGLDETPHFFDDEPWQWAESHWKAFERNYPKMRGWVRSMSGRTRRLTGVPTIDWMMEASRA